MNKKDIAIIGLSGRFPQSENIRIFWDNLVAGKELVCSYKPEELRELGVDEKLINDPNYIPVSSTISHPERFDYAFFGYTKGEAALMDPQIRLMHEQVWLALEDAGCNPEAYKGKIGLYLAASDNLNWRAHALLNPNNEVGSFMSRRLADKSFISTLVAYNLDLRGPGFFTDTACSSSLSAVHFACRSLLMKECSMALAGGATLITTKEKGYWFEEGMIASRDGHCRAFDKDATGTLFGEGIGIVVLKRIEDAIQDKDHIYAVIRSTAVNNDGKRKVGYTAPSVNGQAECISLAHKVAGVEPASITYIEAHGTGTRIGDAVEIEALNKAFGYNTTHRCAIGSVKSNLGHLDAVAGVAGLIKTALSLQHKTLPPSINFSTPNPDINFEAGPFYVNNELQQWERKDGQPLRAGVSSFGIGGTNAHAILEEAPERELLPPEQTHRLLVFSARTPAALNNYGQQLRGFVEAQKSPDLSGLAYTLQTGRKHFKYRSFLVYDEQQKTFAGLPDNGREHQPGHVVFMFSGGGSQYFRMAEQLYQADASFKALMDEGFEKLKKKTGRDFRQVLGYTNAAQVDKELINSIRYMLPALFLVEYAMAKLLMKNGIRPDYMIGHSLGEYVAACISGVFSFDDALQLVITRADLTDTVPEGGMVGVELSEKDVQPYLGKLSIAAINMEDSCVLSGPKEDIRLLTDALTRDGINFTALKISIAAHSSMFDGILDDYRMAVHQVTLHAPQIPFVSNLSGKEITALEATSPEYWVRHLRHTVNFVKGLEYLLERGPASYIEIGSGGVLTSFLKQHPLFRQDNLSVNVLRHPKEASNDHAWYLQALGRLWKNGVAIDWDAFNNHRQYYKVSAPGYVFDATELPVRVDPFRRMMAGGAVLSTHKRAPEDSLYFVNWKKSIFSAQPRQETPATYLVFRDADTALSDVFTQLAATGRVIEVRPGAVFEEAADLFTLDPYEQEHYEQLFKRLDDQDIAIDQLIYNWELVAEDDLMAPCIPVTLLCRQLIMNQAQHLKKFTFIARLGASITGNETADVSLHLVKETAEMIIRNNAAAFFCSIDLDTPGKSSAALLQDIRYNFSDAAIAWRNNKRWIRFFDRIRTDNNGQVAVIKNKGVYLVVNGDSHTGRILSRYLSERYEALVITVADAADRDALQQLAVRLEEEHGRISGVIFIPAEQEVSDLSDLNNLIRIQHQKLQSIQHLYAVFKDRQPDFVWIPLRLSSVLHHVTEHIYADAYTRLFVSQAAEEIPNWHVISLDDIHPGEGDEQELVKLFELTLQQGVSNALVACQPVDELLKKGPRKEIAADTQENNTVITDRHYVAPEGKLESELCELWQSFLAAGRIGATDNFFELGGNSLKAMTLLKRIQKQYNVQLDLKDFYAKPTVKLLAQEINIATLLKSQQHKKDRRTLKI
ncbi:type I polyketide synthase [uncultured Chitinophaga sp.]|jgi:Polyketide synthase modules and related proteins|uniref:type I polyketide synthase n=1 Tax=uncultured Chitinophaga sp. TaxID=339340 RepID=UPI0026119E2A|nr:type I polyketide synthase [uncultured Chitinophaga sp.]